MIDDAGREENGLDKISILTFTIMGTRMGADAQQILRMLDPLHAAEAELEVHPFHERISFRTSEVTYHSPRVLLLRNDRDGRGLMIDRPEDIHSITVDNIRPLPAVLENRMETEAIWGVALLGEEIVLLVDLYKLFSSARSRGEAGCPPADA